jgi:hypothetical protein
VYSYSPLSSPSGKPMFAKPMLVWLYGDAG